MLFTKEISAFATGDQNSPPFRLEVFHLEMALKLTWDHDTIDSSFATHQAQ